MIAIEEIPPISFYKRINYYLNKRQPITKKRALAWYLNVPMQKVRELTFPDFAYTVNGYEYLVLTDEERFQVVKEILENNLVCYVKGFFSSMPELRSALTPHLETNYSMVDYINRWIGFDKFVEAVINIYGYSFFLGQEIRIYFRGKEYFAYREVD